MKGQPRRDWTAARAKVEAEGTCRFRVDSAAFRGGVWNKGCHGALEAAHVIGRDRDRQDGYRVLPIRVVPLCHYHHGLYDDHDLDLLSSLTVAEQAQAVVDAGGLELARRRMAPSAYRKRVAA